MSFLSAEEIATTKAYQERTIASGRNRPLPIEKVQRIRELAGTMTQSAIARAVGCAPNTVYYILKGYRRAKS